MAHGIPYVATASVADLHDLESKVTTAMGIQGARYIHIHVPCPLGWGSDPAHTMKVARMAVESGLFPLIEARSGAVVDRTRIRRKVPVERYLELQTRFTHLFEPQANREAIAAIQAIADENIATYRLIESRSS
jgi:pyruvate ferredoxin oxidoreductase beta subunit